MSEFWLGMLDASGVLIDLRQVPEADWRDGVNTVALKQKPDLALGRYRFERVNNSFGYKFVPVSKTPAIENAAQDAALLPALVRAILDLNGRGMIGKAEVAALRAFLASVDSKGNVDAEGL